MEKYWLGPEPLDDLKEYIRQMELVKSLEREIKQLKKESTVLEEQFEKTKPKNIKKELKSITDLNENSLKHCIECMVMNQKYPELLRINREKTYFYMHNEYYCICEIQGSANKHHGSVQQKRCICQTKGISILRYEHIIIYIEGLRDTLRI